MTEKTDPWWSGVPFPVEADVEPLFLISFIDGGLLDCDTCGEPACKNTGAPPGTDQHYYGVAKLAYQAGWVAIIDKAHFSVRCKKCSESTGSET